ncbi:MAG: glycoside hydrolase family 31 protein [Clostridia bacterium]|nr:glycoside hydrolase family 31 protein [Clostridia bacterium]MBQ1554501.1 glycoside hydrolase family 31 protein [Clostridia bacterium]
MNYGRIKSFHAEGNRVEILFEHQKAAITAITDEIINIFSPGQSEINHSFAIEGDKSKPVNVIANMVGNYIVISTSKLAVYVYDQCRVNFYTSDGTVLCRDYKGEREAQGVAIISKEAAEQARMEGHVLTDGLTRHAIEVVKCIEGDEYFYGLGDKYSFLDKKGYDFEMWNSDLPEPHFESMTRLYKSIPFLLVHREAVNYGIFFDNHHRTYFDLGKENDGYYSFAADEGNLDYYLIYGTTLKSVISGYTYLTGTTPLPQLWTLGYHQCRWSYENRAELLSVADSMRENEIPCDVLYCDIDYMDHFKVFTWGESQYPDHRKMLEELQKRGFKVVTIIDPGVKKEEGYFVYDEGIANDYFVHAPDGSVYENVVWPGDSVFPDFGRRAVRNWWADKQKCMTDDGVAGIWNDMNEPASFRGEIPGDVVFYDEERASTHREMHNVYASLMAKATYEGIRRHTGKRPFVITRAFYSGAQKYTTAWTGDNQSHWSHLRYAIAQLCSIGMSGLAFIGTDVGGFGANCTAELLCRWTQVGCLSPFFRNHAAKGTRHQEPWAFDRQTMEICRKYIRLRYRLIPYLYDCFRIAEATGIPVFRPLVLNFEKDANTARINDQFMVGDWIMAAPIVDQGKVSRDVYLPKGCNWYDFHTGERFPGGSRILREAPLDTCPIYIKEGAILPLWPVMNYVGEKKVDCLELMVFGSDGTYTHYQDNGEDFAYRDGEYNLYQFMRRNGRLSIEMTHAGYAERYEAFKVTMNGKTFKIKFSGRKLVI